jgi:hypothetical protein
LSQYAKDIIDISDRLFRYAEPAATLVTGAAAEPLSGLYGLANLAITRNPDAAANAVNQAQRALTYQPRTAQGQAGLRGLQDILQPIGEVVQGASQNLGDKAYGATGSPALAAAAYSAPTAMLEALGLKGLSIAKSPVKAADLYSARMGMGDIPAEYADNFNQWFGKSKAKKGGKPIVLYHGTNRKGGIDDFGDGINFFSESPEYSSNWAVGMKAIQPDGSSFPESASVSPVYLSIKKPYDGDKNPLNIWLEEDVYNPEVLEMLKSKGYDGAFWTDGRYNGGLYKNWISFSPEQIKSAVGNSGNFSKSSKSTSN